METYPHQPHHKARVANEAIGLYDMNVDDVFRAKGYVVIDSSLGLVTESRASHHARKDRGTGSK